MKEVFTRYGIDIDTNQLQKFEQFLEIFMETNSQINLSAIRDRADIISKHFIA